VDQQRPEKTVARTPSVDRATGGERGRSAEDEVYLRVDGVLPPLLPEGLYTVQSLRAEKIVVFKRRVLILHLEIIGGEHDGVQTFWAASLPEPGHRPGIASKLYRAWLMVAGRRPSRGERLSASMLVHKRFTGFIGTVTKDFNQRRLSEAARYSIVRELVEMA
jgi:hypothetical protein